MLRMRVDTTATVKLFSVLTVLCALLELYIRSRPYTKVTAKIKNVKLLVLFHSKTSATDMIQKKTFNVSFSLIL